VPWTFFVKCKACGHPTRMRGDTVGGDPSDALRGLLEEPVRCEKCQRQAAYQVSDLERLEGNSDAPAVPPMDY
jgi:hypothetical protein